MSKAYLKISFKELRKLFKVFLLVFIMVNAKVIQFRRGRHNIHERHFLIEIEGIAKKEDAMKFVDKKVIWKSPAGKEIEGKIAATHGTKGVVRAIFEKGLPGQSIGTKVEIK